MLTVSTRVALASEATPAPPPPIGPEAFEVLRDFFDHDADVPLDVVVVERTEEAGYVREKLVFRGVRDSRVPAYLALPKRGDGPFPGVILLHGIGGSKDGWWDDDSSHAGGLLTKRLLAAGYAVLTLDCQYHGERVAENGFESPAVFTFQRGWLRRARNMVVQSAVEHRRAIDLLAARPDIDGSRLGVVGYSMGGMLAFVLAAVDPRVTAAVACVPPVLDDPYSALSVQNYAPRIANRAFLLLVAEDDRRNYTPEAARRLHELVASPQKAIHVYEGGHLLPAEWTERAAKWIDAHLQ